MTLSHFGHFPDHPEENGKYRHRGAMRKSQHATINATGVNVVPTVTVHQLLTPLTNANINDYSWLLAALLNFIEHLMVVIYEP